MKTNELIGPALDWAVAKCEGIDVKIPVLPWTREKCITIWYPGCSGGGCHRPYSPSAGWSQGGQIIEREKIATWWSKGRWNAQYPDTSSSSFGPTPLIAAMRCYVASKLGDEVDVPPELL